MFQTYKFQEQEIITLEITKLLKEWVVKLCDREECNLIFTIFIRKKKDRNMFIILNCWTSADLKDVFTQFQIMKIIKNTIYNKFG